VNGLSGMLENLNGVVSDLRKEVGSLAQDQNESRRQMKNLEVTVNQLASEVNTIKEQGSGKLPSQPKPTNGNMSRNVNAVTTRSGRVLQDKKMKDEGELEVPEKRKETEKPEEEVEDEVITP